MCRKTWGWLAGEDETKNHPRSLEEEGTGARARPRTRSLTHSAYRPYLLITFVDLIYL